MTTTTAPATTCAPWCHQGDGHPGETPDTAQCMSDTPGDTLITPAGEAATYLTASLGDGVWVRIEVGGTDGAVKAVTASVAEARAWFAAGLAVCDLAEQAGER